MHTRRKLGIIQYGKRESRVVKFQLGGTMYSVSDNYNWRDDSYERMLLQQKMMDEQRKGVARSRYKPTGRTKNNTKEDKPFEIKGGLVLSGGPAGLRRVFQAELDKKQNEYLEFVKTSSKEQAGSVYNKLVTMKERYDSKLLDMENSLKDATKGLEGNTDAYDAVSINRDNQIAIRENGREIKFVNYEDYDPTTMVTATVADTVAFYKDVSQTDNPQKYVNDLGLASIGVKTGLATYTQDDVRKELAYSIRAAEGEAVENKGKIEIKAAGSTKETSNLYLDKDQYVNALNLYFTIDSPKEKKKEMAKLLNGDEKAAIAFKAFEDVTKIFTQDGKLSRAIRASVFASRTFKGELAEVLKSDSFIDATREQKVEMKNEVLAKNIFKEGMRWLYNENLEKAGFDVREAKALKAAESDANGQSELTTKDIIGTSTDVNIKGVVDLVNNGEAFSASTNSFSNKGKGPTELVVTSQITGKDSWVPSPVVADKDGKYSETSLGFNTNTFISTNLDVGSSYQGVMLADGRAAKGVKGASGLLDMSVVRPGKPIGLAVVAVDKDGNAMFRYDNVIYDAKVLSRDLFLKAYDKEADKYGRKKLGIKAEDILVSAKDIEYKPTFGNLKSNNAIERGTALYAKYLSNANYTRDNFTEQIGKYKNLLKESPNNQALKDSIRALEFDLYMFDEASVNIPRASLGIQNIAEGGKIKIKAIVRIAVDDDQAKGFVQDELIDPYKNGKTFKNIVTTNEGKALKPYLNKSRASTFQRTSETMGSNLFGTYVFVDIKMTNVGGKNLRDTLVGSRLLEQAKNYFGSTSVSLNDDADFRTMILALQ